MWLRWREKNISRGGEWGLKDGSCVVLDVNHLPPAPEAGSAEILRRSDYRYAGWKSIPDASGPSIFTARFRSNSDSVANHRRNSAA